MVMVALVWLGGKERTSRLDSWEEGMEMKERIEKREGSRKEGQDKD